ncbi:SIR2 family protein [Mycobacterium sp. IS-836]|uniref:SIR2 family protein n=1 Tax=Mycobacterium sp. IS-836 TaxID=1834160 RepID=UPI0009F83FDB|nr:SIR2 family protein [Mycobacterium sp. IS-836]
MPDRLEGLKLSLARPDAVLFIGSGVSCWSGLPTWVGLLNQLADFMGERGLPTQLIQREISRGDLLQAASYGFYQLTPSERSAFLRDACKLGESEPSELHEAITKLGPTAFITTNYDKLLEAALHRYRPDRYFRVVGNWDIIEVPNVIQATARDFVFKPHGDIDSSDSIIITREDYRSLQGEKRFVFESLKILLATRPVIFIGFGLRDPDFLLIKDTLAETFNAGGLSDQYAIVADVEAEEIPYWRQNFGIHLISYETSRDHDNNHYPLLALIESISPIVSSAATSQHNGPIENEADEPWSEPDYILRLIRLCARMQMLTPDQLADEIPLRIRLPRMRWNHRTDKYLRFNGSLAVQALLKISGRVLLTASPGAGKTYTLRAVTRRAAINAQAALLEGNVGVRVPVYVELKSYSGDLWELVQSVLPLGIDLEHLVDNDLIMILLDGVNEVESSHFESDSFGRDLASFVKRIADAPLIIASRSNVGLGQTEFIECVLDEVDIEYVQNRVPTDNLALLQLAQKPLFLRLVEATSAVADIPSLPQGLYLAYFNQIKDRFESKFDFAFDFVPMFAAVAFELVNDGRQTFMASTLTQLIEDAIGDHIDPNAVANWLIESDVLVPLPGARLAFAHHSLSEYLAAYQLSRLYTVTPGIVRRCLSRRSWDVAILLTLGFLPTEEADQLFERILHTDPNSALDALDYVEMDRSALLRSCLLYIDQLENLSFEEERTLARSLERVQTSADSADLLWRLSHRGGLIGGAASKLLMQQCAPDNVDNTVDTLLGLAIDRDDYNFSSAVGRAVASRISKKSIVSFLERVNAIEVPLSTAEALRLGASDESYVAISVLGEHILAGTSAAEVAALANLSGGHNLIIKEIVLDAISGDGSFDALQISAAFIADGYLGAIFTLYSQVRFRSPRVEDVDSIYSARVREMLYGAISGQTRAGMWAVELLRVACEVSAVWRAHVREDPYQGSRLRTAAFLYAVGDVSQFFAHLEDLLHNADADKTDAWILRGCTVDWSGRENLLIELLKLRDVELAYSIFEPMLYFTAADLSLELDDADWWIDWLCEPVPSDEFSLFPDRLAEFIVRFMSSETAARIKERFNYGDDNTRRALSAYVLNRDDILRFEELTPDSVSWLVADLERRDPPRWRSHLLGIVATQDFTEAVLIPLLEDNPSQELRDNLREVLQECGRRHGKRYITVEDRILG